MKLTSEFSELRCFRVDAAPERLLIALSCGSPLFIQAANPLAALCTVESLGEMAGDTGGRRVFFPDNGLELAIEDIARIHAVELETLGDSILSVEFALAGAPRALILATPPGHANAAIFRKRIGHLAKRPVERDRYETWCRNFLREPVLCSCCVDAAKQRRANPSAHPIAIIFQRAIDMNLPLRCTLMGGACGFTSTLMPASLDFNPSSIDLTGADGTTQLGIDPGICHSLAVEPLTLDGEKHSILRLFDSLGQEHFQLTASGWDACAAWVAVCRESPTVARRT